MPLRLFAAVAVLAVLLPATRAAAADFTDAAGRNVMLPEHVSRVLPAERNAEIMLYALAPEKLAGSSRGPGRVALPRGSGWHAVLGWRLRGNPATLAATAQRVGAELIVDAGTPTPDRAAFADEVMRQSGIPYILVDDSFSRVPRSMRAVAAVTDAEERHTRDLWRYAEHAIAALHGNLLIVPANARPRVYYARGADGLTTALPGSPAGEAISEAGAINVATPLGRGSEIRVTPTQLHDWNPDIIIATPRAYAAIRRSGIWRGLMAVRNRRVYLEPTYPFGWLEDPAGVNRLIGLYWLTALFYPDQAQDDLRSTTCEFYDKFYRIRLTTAQLERMLRAAGVPAAQPLQPVGEPLPGLGPNPLGSGGLPTTQRPASAAAQVKCSLPGSTLSPVDLSAPPVSPGAVPGLSPPPGLGVPPLAPGIPPPGRRGRPAARLDAPPAALADTGSTAPLPGEGPAYQYQTRP